MLTPFSGRGVPPSSLQAWRSCVLCAWTLPSGRLSGKSCVTRPASLGAGGRPARLPRARPGESEGGRPCRGAAVWAPLGGRRSTQAAAPCGPLAFPPCGWETRALAPCLVTCGGGQVPLAVRCVRMDRGRLVSLPHSKCWPTPRPRPLEACSPEPCPARSASLRRPVVPGQRPCRVVSSCPKPCVLTRRRGSYWCREDRGGGFGMP